MKNALISRKVEYNNDLNSISLGSFNEKELNLFFSILYKMKRQDIQTVEINFKELKELSNFRHRGLERFIKDLDNVYKKLLELNLKIEDEEKILRFVLFTKYEIDKKNKFVKIAVNEDFKYILNDFIGNYTKFDLIDFVNLKSNYSKGIFKLLKQYQNSGKYIVKIDDFRRILNIPESYRITDITKVVLKPSVAELRKHFKNLEFEKIKVGRKIERISFTFESNEKNIEIISSKKNLPNEFVDIQELIPELTKKEICQLLNQYEKNKIIEKYFYIKMQDTKVDNFYGYILKALKEDYSFKKNKTNSPENDMDDLKNRLKAKLTK